MSTGPNNFINRVNFVFNEIGSNRIPRILNPDPLFFNKQYDSEMSIARIDGVYFYKASRENIRNLVSFRYGSNPNNITKFYPYLVFNNLLLNRYLNRYIRKCIRSSVGTVFQSEFSRDCFQKFVGKLPDNNTIILNGVPLTDFKYKKSSSNKLGSPSLVITANFRPAKRLVDAVMLVQEISKDFPNVKLNVIGEIDPFSRSIIEQKGINQSLLNFHNRIKDIDLVDIYARCDVGLSPSLYDPCPNSVSEMMACGLPVISTSASGAAELILENELLVEENLPLEYTEFYVYSKLPKINIFRWKNAIYNVFENQKLYSEFVLQRAKRKLDIRKTALDYLTFYEKSNS